MSLLGMFDVMQQETDCSSMMMRTNPISTSTLVFSILSTNDSSFPSVAFGKRILCSVSSFFMACGIRLKKQVPRNIPEAKQLLNEIAFLERTLCRVQS